MGKFKELDIELQEAAELLRAHGRALELITHIDELQAKNKMVSNDASDKVMRHLETQQQLKARIAELEEYKYISEMATLSMNKQIKADAIREMVMTSMTLAPESRSIMYQSIIDYADELERE